jgi:hypothetical protein
MTRHLLVGSLLMFAALVAGTAAQAKDGFESVQCNSDVRAAMIGKKMSDEPIEKIEKRHTALGLKGLGGDEVSDTLNSVSWEICGKEYYTVLDLHEVIRDVIAFPAHSKTEPEFASAGCQANGKTISDVVVGTLDNAGAKPGAHYSMQDKTLLPTKTAWKINGDSGKLSPLGTTDLKCPVSDVITTDGGP